MRSADRTLLVYRVEHPRCRVRFLYTEAPRVCCPAAAPRRRSIPRRGLREGFANAVSRLLAPSLAISADPALSPDARSVLLSGKQNAGQPWQIWEIPLAGGPPRQVTSGTDDCIRPFYASAGKFVYSRQTPQGLPNRNRAARGRQSSTAHLAPGSFLPDGMMRDGRVLFEAAFPGTASIARELYTCIHRRFRCRIPPLRSWAGPPLRRRAGDRRPRLSDRRRAGAFQLGARRTTRTGACRRENMPARWRRLETGEWLAAYRAATGNPYWICRFPAAAVRTAA